MRAILSILLLVGSSFGASNFSISRPDNNPVIPGGKLNLQLVFTPGTPSPAAVQWDFVFPSTWGAVAFTTTDGTIATNAGKTTKCNGPRCIVAPPSSGPLNNTAIGSGVLVNVVVTVPASVPFGSATINLTGFGAVDTTGSAITTSVNGVTVTVPSPCDLNQDGVVNTLDYGLIINQIFGISTCTADLDQDGKCTVVDMERIVLAANGQSCRVGP